MQRLFISRAVASAAALTLALAACSGGSDDSAVDATTTSTTTTEVTTTTVVEVTTTVAKAEEPAPGDGGIPADVGAGSPQEVLVESIVEMIEAGPEGAAQVDRGCLEGHAAELSDEHAEVAQGLVTTMGESDGEIPAEVEAFGTALLAECLTIAGPGEIPATEADG